MPHTNARKKIFIAGGSGFLGISLATHLTDLGYEVVIASRHPPRVIGAWRHVLWDARTVGDWQRELDGAAGLVNLAGRSVDCIKTPDHCDEILRSRVQSTLVLGRALRNVDRPPPVWVQMSTAHIYGDPPTAICDETSPLGYGLAPTVGQAWEEAFRTSLGTTQRGVILRTSFVLGRDAGAGGGAFPTLVRLTRCGLGGRIGSGRQGISWIHQADFNRLIERAIVDDAMQGVYVASASQPVSQREFMAAVRRAIRMPIGLPTPEWAVRWGARWIMRTDPELAIYGRYVISRRLSESGFEFRYPDVGSALGNLLLP